jgi:hypothetical protein
MKTMMVAAAAVIAVGVGTVGTALAKGEGDSATGTVEWQTSNRSANTAVPQFHAWELMTSATQQYAYVRPPFRGSDNNGQG